MHSTIRQSSGFFRALDRGNGMAQHQVKARLATRFNSMLQELYGGRKALRTYLLAGRFVDIRLPPLDRNPEGERRPMPPPRARPNGAERRAKYYSRLAADLADCARTGEARNPHRTTRLWEEFLPQAGQEEYRSRRHAREADRLNQARGGRSPDRREDSREHRQGRPSGGSRVSADPGLDAGDGRRPRSRGWGRRRQREEFQDTRRRRY